MLQNDTEPRLVERHETTSVDERTSQTVGPAQAPPPLDLTDHTEQASKSAAGIERRESAVTDQSGLAHSERTTRDVGAENRQMFSKIAQVVWLFIGMVEVLIGLRVVLKLIGANAANDFAGFVYNFAGVFLAPFVGLTGSPSSGGMVLEIPSLIAMFVYALLGWGITEMILPLFYKQTTSSTSTYDRYRG